MEILKPSQTVSFADVAHQTLVFDSSDAPSRLVLSLLETRWVQRLRRIRQTGNTNLVYMFSEHSRFGHSLGVAFLATELMRHLSSLNPEKVLPYRDAVAAAALLHDTGHTAPGSHLAPTLWSPGYPDQHEEISIRIAREDPEISGILYSFSPTLPDLVGRILANDPELPRWTTAVISGGGWNADRGNWTIVDSAMCSVSYGRYNVRALIDAFKISNNGDLVLQENRLDALTHFFVARDSMYRQVYQHRVLQAADALTRNIVLRLRDLLGETLNHGLTDAAELRTRLSDHEIYCDNTLARVLLTNNYALKLPLDVIFEMTENWWNYHVERWCGSKDQIFADLSRRLRDRKLFKTIRLDLEEDEQVITKATSVAKDLGLDPRYYVVTVNSSDLHRGKSEQAPLVLRDNGQLVDVSEVEPLIQSLLGRSSSPRRWLAVPKEIKERLGRLR